MPVPRRVALPGRRLRASASRILSRRRPLRAFGSGRSEANRLRLNFRRAKEQQPVPQPDVDRDSAHQPAAPLLRDFRQQRRRFGDLASPAPGTTGSGSGEVPQGCRLHLRAQGSALVFFDLRRNRSPGSWRTCGWLRRRRRSAVRPPENRGHGTGMFALAAVRRRSCPQPQTFVFRSRKAPDSPAEPGFRTAGRPKNRARNPKLASGFDASYRWAAAGAARNYSVQTATPRPSCRLPPAPPSRRPSARRSMTTRCPSSAPHFAM